MTAPTTVGRPTIEAPHREHTRAVTATSAAHSRHLICTHPAADAQCHTTNATDHRRPTEPGHDTVRTPAHPTQPHGQTVPIRRNSGESTADSFLKDRPLDPLR